jgi:hypothetical protein
LDGNNGFVVPGLNVGDHLGSSVSTARDVNGVVWRTSYWGLFMHLLVDL